MYGVLDNMYMLSLKSMLAVDNARLENLFRCFHSLFKDVCIIVYLSTP